MENRNKAHYKKTADLFRKAIPKMSQLEIPLTPENYHTWYEYTNGDNDELNSTIDELLKNGKKFTSKINNELFNKYIYHLNEEGLRLFQKDVERLVDMLLEKITGMSRTTQNFSASLKKYSEILKSDPDIESVAELIASLIDDVGSVLETNESMGFLLESMNQEVDSLRDSMRMLNFKAYTDKLTDVPNRRAFDKRLDELFDNYHEEGQVFSLLFIDIDHFKKFNDTHGHDVGDRVLRYVASVITGGIKGDDMLTRYGGEEFAILLPNTGYDDAISVGNYLRNKVSGSRLVDNSSSKDIKQLGHVTVSVGVAIINTEDNVESIVKRADQCLYAAKERGRNMVVGENDITDK